MKGEPFLISVPCHGMAVPCHRMAVPCHRMDIPRHGTEILIILPIIHYVV